MLTFAHTTDDLYDDGNLFRMDNTAEAARRIYAAAAAAAATAAAAGALVSNQRL